MSYGIPNPRVAAARKASSDIKFLETVRSAGLVMLEAMLRNHSHKATPRWKRVAIKRAIARLSPRPLDWTLCLDELNPREMHQWQIEVLAETRARIDAGR